ncbi:hypothetical protein BJY04DRAFT_221644 [Aspergillus karnatakaensis]|uniref:uncharacterized protein n=1 Tax=Aspergillus karnatakaensis TaxID=1810916 RepID=UPI003CCE3800
MASEDIYDWVGDFLYSVGWLIPCDERPKETLRLSDLPQELIDMITRKTLTRGCDISNRQTLRALCLVNRQFYYSAHPHLYRSVVTIVKRKERKNKAYLSEGIVDLSLSAYAPFVETLQLTFKTFHLHADYKMFFRHLATVLSRLTALRWLKIYPEHRASLEYAPDLQMGIPQLVFLIGVGWSLRRITLPKLDGISFSLPTKGHPHGRIPVVFQLLQQAKSLEKVQLLKLGDAECDYRSMFDPEAPLQNLRIVSGCFTTVNLKSLESFAGSLRKLSFVEARLQDGRWAEVWGTLLCLKLLVSLELRDCGYCRDHPDFDSMVCTEIRHERTRDTGCFVEEDKDGFVKFVDFVRANRERLGEWNPIMKRGDDMYEFDL